MAKNMENQKVICNKCGRELKKVNGILHEDGIFVTKDWGYFSKKDLRIHKFNLCEACYDELAESFLVPVTEEDKETALD